MQKFYRQGDVLIIKIDKLPDELQKAKDMVLLEGETTGHMHRVSGNATVFEPPRYSGDGLLKIVEAKEGTQIVHEEHAPITLEPGIYECRRQREYDEKEIRYVMD